MPERPQHRLGLVLVTASAVAWSLAGLFTRLVPFDVWTLLLWRSAFAALGILVFLVSSGHTRFRALGRPGLAYAASSAAGMVCYIASLKLTSVAHNAVIYATAPFVTGLIGWFILHEAPRRSALVAAGLALAGVAVMTGFGVDGDPAGDALAFAMTLCMAAIMIISRRHPDMPALEAGWASSVLSALVALPFADALTPQGADWAWLAAFGLVNSALGMALFTIGARYLAPIEMALIGALDAPLAPIWVWLAFAEAPSLVTLAGGGLVFAAVLAHILWSARRS